MNRINYLTHQRGFFYLLLSFRTLCNNIITGWSSAILSTVMWLNDIALLIKHHFRSFSSHSVDWIDDYQPVKACRTKIKKSNRVFFSEVWHQHDGILYPSNATTFRQNFIDSNESKILQDIQAYIMNCCPIFCYEVQGVSAPEILENMDMMNRSLENTYCHRFNECTAPDVLKKSLLAVSKPFYTFYLVKILVFSFFFKYWYLCHKNVKLLKK